MMRLRDAEGLLAVAHAYIHVVTLEAFMGVASGRTFRSGNSEAVRLPKDVAFGRELDVTIVRSGDVLTIFPSRPSVSDLVARLAELPRPDSVEFRDVDAIPERHGL
jgi:antitoxin VapB